MAMDTHGLWITLLRMDYGLWIMDFPPHYDEGRRRGVEGDSKLSYGTYGYDYPSMGPECATESTGSDKSMEAFSPSGFVSTSPTMSRP